ncbi:MAG: molybdopterin-synthase adenylyltransferase MoeB [Deltaproteobacteria bacterium]|nr:molybdopterin-synthase adenylyltransferase MoeB [Deltaproteobacteria bacterium]
MELTKDQIARYSRHLIMPEVGPEGQKRLLSASVLTIGAGGLGSPLALYLAAAGVGRIGIVDHDVVDFSNLQRQIIHREADLNRPKVESAKERINSINSDVKVETYQERLTSENAMEIFKNYDIIIDGTDNFATRYLVNDACVLLGKPNVYGSIFRFEGQVSVFDAHRGPCYRCLYPEPPPPGLVPSCAEGGVLGILPGIVGTLQAAEAIKLILGKGEPLIGRLLVLNVLDMEIRELKLRKDPNCPICGKNRTITKLIDYEEFCGIGRGQEAPAPEPSGGVEITAKELKALLESPRNNFVLVDVREPHEYEICKIPGATLIPLSQLAMRAEQELHKNAQIVTHCHHGMRSLKGLEILKKLGFKDVRSLQGGIDAWSADVDPSVPRY